ncbi:MAG: sporulation integral membrane protein YtvI [Lachnospiraceae bacterium]|jgi:sporulation integral membrane protein YtvI|nr:sporulation integral membrane protein YtvI [Lachnospiraceae bacterium]
MDSVRKYARILLNIGIPLAGILLACWVIPRLLGYFMPFVIGWLIAMIANPLVRFLESRMKLVRKHGSVLIMVLALVLVIGLGYFLVSRLLYQAFGLVKDLPEMYAAVSAVLEDFFRRFDEFYRFLPPNVMQAWSDFTGNVGQMIGLLLQKAASPTVEAAGNVAMRIPNAMVNVIVTILSAYFFLAERERILELWQRYLPEGGNRYCRKLREDLIQLVSGYFMAQFKIMFMVALILLAGFLVLGIRYAFLLAVLIAVLDFLPLFGTGTVLLPWAAVKLLSGEYMLAAGLAMLYVVSQVTRQMVQPKIVGDSMGLPPLLTLFLLYLGFKARGISGMILAVPLGILAMRLYEYGMFDSLIENVKLLVREIGQFRRGE